MSRCTLGASSDSCCGEKNAAEIRNGFRCAVPRQRGIGCRLRRAATSGVDQATRPRCGGIDAARSAGMDECLLRLRRPTEHMSKYFERMSFVRCGR
jgi:hypothetical protein